MTIKKFRHIVQNTLSVDKKVWNKKVSQNLSKHLEAQSTFFLLIINLQ